MSILDFFTEFMTTAVVTRLTPTYVEGSHTGDTETVIGTFNCLYSEGAAAEALVSARFRDTTVAAISVEYDSDIESGDEVVVEGKKYKAKDPVITPVGSMKSDGHMLVALEVFG